MRSFRKLVVVAICLVMSVAGFCAAAKKDSAKTAEKQKESNAKKSKDAGKPPAEEKPESTKLAFPVPIGPPSKGVKLPSFGPDGKLKMIFNIGVANRVDEDNVEMKDTQVQTFNEDGSPEMDIALPTSTFNLKTRVITTQQEVDITREDFNLTGHTMEFNTETREGRLGGGVKMIIFNLADETGDTDAAATKEKPPKSALPKVTLPPNKDNQSIKVTKPKSNKGSKPSE
jgi:lipopolysaccharide export system protein LptC